MSGLGYAGANVGNLVACPFCREMFQAGEADTCPACGLPLADIAKLPPSYEATLEDDWPERPEWESLPTFYWRRGRAVLLGSAVAGIAAFFLPWIHETAPELVDLSGYDVARKLGWVWACLVGWGILIPTVLSRRCVARMRGARAATGLFCGIPLVCAAILRVSLPHPPPHLRIAYAYHFGVGIYATMAIALMALPFAVTFGGRLDDLPTRKGRGQHETLH